MINGLFSFPTLLISVSNLFITRKYVITKSSLSCLAPVCTTELGLVAALQDEWDARNVNVIGLSANGLAEHEQWIADINEISKVDLGFPIIADADRKVSTLYDMLDHQVSIYKHVCM